MVYAKGNAFNLGGFIPPGAYGHNPGLNLYTYDTTKARALLAEADYPKGFDVKVITFEAWKLETQIIRRMLERIGLKARLDVLTIPPVEQDWDLFFWRVWNLYGYTGATFLAYPFIEES